MAFARKGRFGDPIEIGEIIPIRREDLVHLNTPRPRREGPAVKRLRDTHHMLARCLAAGMTQTAAAERTGFSINRVSILCQDPAFQNLIATYRSQVDQSFVKEVDTFFSLATANMLKAERMLAEKLEEAEETGDALPTRELIAISRDAADRFGYGKKQTNVNVNVDFAAQLEKAIARSGKADQMKVVGGSSLPQPSVPGPIGPRAPAPPIRRRA